MSNESKNKITHQSKSSLTVVLGYLQMIQKELLTDETQPDKNKLLPLVQKAHKACIELKNNLEDLEELN